MKEPKHAVIYPFLRTHIERILRGKDVICKYVGNGTPNLHEGSKVLFYASGGGFELLGEATIKVMEFLSPRDLTSRYRTRLFISPKELEDYRGVRSPERKLLVMTLSHVREFVKPVEMDKYVTMAGQTLDREQYVTLLGRTNRRN